MSDVYVYYFRGAVGTVGEKMLSTRPATLETIKGKGEPIMESQIVVDHTELDGGGFLIASAGNDTYPVNDLTAQIGSLELRAASRDSQALTLDESIEGKNKYMLGLESRELRRQAARLKSQRTDLTAGEPSDPSGAPEFAEA
jgi:hypothetical protein